ncbi:MAG: tetratricopeptide repeat protein [Rivularia sp. (in: cyanobacteria)]
MNQRKHRKSLQDILKQRQLKSFVGREEQINLFRRNLELSLDNDQRRFIFSVFGQGGVGKTTLLGQFRKIAEESSVVTALTNDEERSVPQAMARLAQHFEKQGHKLDKFGERYKVYRQKKQELESDPEAPQGFSAFLGQTVAKGGLKLAKEVPVAGAAIDFVDADAFASQAGEWTSFVAKKLTNKDEVRLVQEPLEVLTPLFFKEIAEIADNYDIALFFDTYERTDDFLDSWLLDIFDGRYGEIPANILFIIAGRQELDKNHWANYEGLIARFSLEPFTEEEAKQYLARKGITDDQVIKVILNLSGCFPLLLATLAAEVPNDPSKIGDSSGTAVERFLKWVDDPKRREVALNAAIPLCINEDILGQLQGEEGKALFNWLKEMPFVNERHDGWVYHDVVRTQMLRYKRRLSLQGWAELHWKLAEYYDNLRNSLQLDEEKAWLDETWFNHTLDVTYHRLCESSHKYFSVALNEFLVALNNKLKFAQRFAERILQAGENTDSAEVKRWGEKLVEGLKAYEEKRYEKAVEMFTALVEHSQIEVKYLPIALSWRGLTYRNMRNYEDALKDFDRAIEIDPGHKRAIAQRGVSYRLMKRHEDALKDFDRAIKVDPDYKLALSFRGNIYREMKRYEDALKDFDRAIKVDPDYKWAIARRGASYREMKRYEDALKDLNRAIKIDPDYTSALAERGFVYREMKRHEDALKDFDRAIEIDSNYTWGLEQRGITYREVKCYKDALEDFNRAIQLHPENAWAFVQRGITYREMKHYEDALKNFDRAIEIDPDYNWAIAHRGYTYGLMRRYEDALKDFDRAIELNPDDAWAVAQRGYTYRLMKRYEDALKGFDHAIEIDPDYTQALAARGQCYLMLKQYDEALTDINRAVELQEDNDVSLYLRALVYKALNQSAKAKIDLANAVEFAKPKYNENPQDWQNTLNLALYYLAADYIPTAKQLYELALSQNASAEHIHEAICDLDDFLTVFPEHTQAKAMRMLLDCK